jgi:hypothetical protein
MMAMEVYFGWSIPHDAPDGKFVAAKSLKEKQ